MVLGINNHIDDDNNLMEVKREYTERYEYSRH